MSVGVPIYRRILYGSRVMSDTEEKGIPLDLVERDENFEHRQDLANPRMMTAADTLETTRHSFSALATRVSDS